MSPFKRHATLAEALAFAGRELGDPFVLLAILRLKDGLYMTVVAPLGQTIGTLARMVRNIASPGDGTEDGAFLEAISEAA